MTFLVPIRHIVTEKEFENLTTDRRALDQGKKMIKPSKNVSPRVCANMRVTKGASGQSWAEQKWLLNRK